MNLAPALKINGWMSEQELDFLARSASEHNLIVEAGCFYGRSTRALCDNTQGIVHAIDPWVGDYGQNVLCDGTPTASAMADPNVIYSEFTINLYSHIIKKKCIVHRNEFQKCHIENPDMIFIDAIHDYDYVVGDIDHALKLMKKGLLCGHDYAENWQGVVQAVDEKFPNKLHVVDTIWWVKL